MMKIKNDKGFNVYYPLLMEEVAISTDSFYDLLRKRPKQLT